MTLKGEELARQAAEFALEKKAGDIKILDLREISDVADFFVICTGESDTQARAISDQIEIGLKNKCDTRVWHTEGRNAGQWILLDFVDVVIHTFLPDTRAFYGLESLWGDAPATSIEDDIAPFPDKVSI